MARLARRLGLVLTVIFAFVVMQTGAACAFGEREAECADDCADEPADERDADHAPACSEEEQGVPCAPACADCPGCAGPSSAVLLAANHSPHPRTRQVALDDALTDLVATSHAERVDRPPRA